MSHQYSTAEMIGYKAEEVTLCPDGLFSLHSLLPCRYQGRVMSYGKSSQGRKLTYHLSLLLTTCLLERLP